MPFNLIRNENTHLIIKKNIQIPNDPVLPVSVSPLSDKFEPLLTDIKLQGETINISGNQINYINTTPGILESTKAIILDNTKSISNINILGSKKIFINNEELINQDSASASSSHLLSTITEGYVKPGKIMVVDNNKDITNINNLDCSSLETNNLILTSNKTFTERLINDFEYLDSNKFNDICWCPDLKLLIAVGDGCVILSNDGDTWENIETTPNNWVDIKWIAKFSLFIMCSNTGTDRIKMSINGYDWFNTNTDNTYAYNSIGMDNSYVYVFSSDGSYKTTDGDIWTSITVKPENSHNSYNGKDKKLLISSVGMSIYTLTSSNLIKDINTDAVHSNIDSNTVWANITYGNGFWVIVNTNQFNYRLYKSIDGIYWENLNTKGINENFIANGIKFINNIFILYGSNGLYYSLDCNVWILIQLPKKTSISCLTWSDYYGKFYILSGKSEVSNSIVSTLDNIYIINYPLNSNLTINGLCESNNKILLYGSNILYSNSNKYYLSNSNFNVKSIAYSQTLNLYVAVGVNIIYTSTNAIDWTLINGTPNKTWNNIYWDGNKFIVISSDTLLISSNGTSWSSTNLTSSNWFKIIYNEVYIMISTSSPYVRRSTDGTNWGTPTIPQSANIIDICHNSTQFVILFNTSTNRILTSLNGNTWVSRTTPDSNDIFTSIIWCEYLELFIAISTSSILYSVDGIDWEIKTINSFVGKNFNTIRYSSINKNFVLISSDSGFKVYSSKELGTILFKSKSIYEDKNDIDFGLYLEQNINYDLDNIIVGIKRSYTINTNRQWKRAIYSNKLILLSDDEQNNFIGYSTNNGQTLSLTSINSTSKWVDICYGYNKYIAITSTGTNRFLTSSNGIDWNLSSSTLAHAWTSICYDFGIYVVVSSNGKAAKSSDGNNWSLMNNTSGNWTSVTSTSDSFVAVGTNIIMYSKDKLNWNAATCPTGVWKSVCYGNNKIVAVGDSCCMWSTNSVDWVLSTCEACNWESVIWINKFKVFVACASTGTNRFMYSLNGKDWISMSIPSNSWTSIVYNIDYDTIMIISNTAILSSSILKLNEKNTLNMDNLIINENGNMYIGNLIDNDLDYKLATNTLSLYNSTEVNSKLDYNDKGYLNLNSKLNIVNHNGTNKGLYLDNILINTPSFNFNYINNVIPGIALKNKVLVTDNNNTISEINTLSCNTLTTNVINSITPGIGKINSPLIVDSDINITNINNLQTNNLTLSNNKSLYGSKTILDKLYNVKKLYNVQNPSIIIWSNELKIFVLFSNKNIYNSYDGEDWFLVNSTELNIVAGVWSPELALFVFLTDSNTEITIIVSKDGKIWDPVSISGAVNTKDITWGLSKFIIISPTNVYFSGDSINWSSYTSPSSSIAKICFGNNNFVSVLSTSTNNNIYSSTDGINWIQRSKSNNEAFVSLTYKDKFYGSTANNLFMSTNASTWSSTSISNIKDVTRYNNTLIAISTNEIYISKDETNFISIFQYGGLYIESNNDKFIVSGGNNLIVNTDSTTKKIIPITKFKKKQVNFNWIERTLPTPFGTNGVINNYIYYGNKFIILGQDNILYSKSGITWETTSISGNWKSICWNSSRYIMAKLNNLAYSSDLTNWTNISSTGDWLYITYINNKFIVVGTNKIGYSPNGVNWNYTTLTGDWKSISYDNKYIIVGTNKISYSSDLVTWTTTNKTGNWNSICHGLDVNIITSDSSTILYSKDGTNWIEYDLKYNWTQVIYIDELQNFVLVSNTHLAISKNGIDWKYTELEGCNYISWSKDYALLLGLTSTNAISSQFVYPTNLNTVKKSDILSYKDDNVGISLPSGSNPSFKLHLGIDSAAKLSTSTWIVASDERIKENIENANLNECYDIVKNLKLKKYKFKNNQEERLGWIAQEVEQYISEAVTRSKQYGYDDCRSLNTDQIICNAYGTIQKLIMKLEEINVKKEELKEKFKNDLNI